MRQHMWTLAVLACLATFCGVTESRTVVKREANGVHVNTLGHDHDHHVGYADKAKVAAAFGVKNALLGFLFNKINQFIDKKTAWVDQLDHTNIAKNKAQGIYPPKDPKTTLTQVITETIGQKLQAAGPLLTALTSKLTSGSAHGSSHGSSHGGLAGFDFGALLGGGVGAPAAGHAGPAVHGGASYSAGYGAI